MSDDDGVTSTQSLLYAHQSDITIERIQALVQQVGPESPTVEYKMQMTNTIAKGIAALANTYGGLLLVGVSDDRRVTGVKEKTIERVAEHCAAKIEPPWVPEIIPVPLGDDSDKYVLVLRVVPGHHPRPLLVDGIAYVRHQNTCHPADWQRLCDLFTEVSPAQHERAWTIQSPNMPTGVDGTDDSAVDFVVRTGLNLAVAREAKWRPLSERTVTTLTDALNHSPLQSALRNLTFSYINTGGFSPFRRQGFNRSRTIRLQWAGAPEGWPEGRPQAVGATVRIEVPGGHGDHATNMLVQIDVVVRHSVWTKVGHGSARDEPKFELNRWRVTAQQLGDLIDAALDTLTSDDIVGAVADLAAIDTAAVPQPRVLYLRTGRAVTEVLETAGLRLIPDAGTSRGADLLADPALDLADPGDRRSQVRMWLVQIALDAGLLGMEQLLEHLDAPKI